MSIVRALAPAALLCAALGWAIAPRLGAPYGFCVDVDTVRDILVGQNLGAGGVPAASCVPSSAGLWQGSGFAWCLDFIARRGWPMEAVLPAAFGGFALGSLALYWVLAVQTSAAAALLAVSLFSWFMMSYALGAPNGQEAFIPAAALCQAAAAAWALRARGSWRTAAMLCASAALAAATQVHIVFLLLYPAFLLWALRERRGWSWAAGHLAILAAAWLVVSPGAVRMNLQVLAAFFHGGGRRAAGALALAAAAGLLAACDRLVLRRLQERGAGSGCDWFWAVQAGSFLLMIGAIALSGHPGLRSQPFKYLGPLLPMLCILAARAVHAASSRLLPGRGAGFALGTAGAGALVLLASCGRAGVSGVPSTQALLRFDELSAVSGALKEWGVDVSGSYALITSGQPVYMGFLQGLWLHAPCPPGGAVSPQGVSGARRVLLAAVPPGFSLSVPGPAGEVKRVSTPWRDLLLMRYDSYMDYGRISVLSDSGPRPVSLAVASPLKGEVCRDPSLPFLARSLIARSDEPVTVRIPLAVGKGAAAGPRVFWLPELDVWGRPRAGCAGRFVRVSGVVGTVREAGRLLEVRAAAAGRAGFVDIVWPTGDRSCFPDNQAFFPMPVFEAPRAVFEKLRPYLEGGSA